MFYYSGKLLAIFLFYYINIKFRISIFCKVRNFFLKKTYIYETRFLKIQLSGHALHVTVPTSASQKASEGSLMVRFLFFFVCVCKLLRPLSMGNLTRVTHFHFQTTEFFISLSRLVAYVDQVPRKAMTTTVGSGSNRLVTLYEDRPDELVCLNALLVQEGLARLITPPCGPHIFLEFKFVLQS